MSKDLKEVFLTNYATKELEKECENEQSLLNKAINEYLSKTKTDKNELLKLIETMLFDLVKIYANCKNINLHLSVDIVTKYFKNKGV